MSFQYYTHQGSFALSDFRCKRLASKIGAHRVTAKHVHFVALRETLSEAEQQALDFLLTYDDVPPARALTTAPEPAGLTTHTFYVSPRVGTISPWSSKATSIAHVCGLEQQVERIERGTVYLVTSSSGANVTACSNCLYDRMTQTISAHAPDLHDMFAQGAPASAIAISLHEQGKNAHQTLEAVNTRYGLALDISEINYLADIYGPDGALRRDPYLEELFMFAQINSEVLHCLCLQSCKF